MSLKDTVEFLNSGDDELLSRYIRAVRLFEFEVSIIYPRSFKRLTQTQAVSLHRPAY
jgi:hypothetical protein